MNRLAMMAMLVIAPYCVANKDACVIVVTPKGSGSGTIVGADANGAYVLTNKHVVSSAEKAVWVVHKGKRIPAKLVKEHHNADMSMVQAKLENFGVAEVADEGPKKDDKVHHRGRSTGAYDPAYGKIIGWKKCVEDEREICVFDAFTDMGDSGSAVFNEQGKVVGLFFARHGKLYQEPDESQAVMVHYDQVRDFVKGSVGKR